jgi:hypothetical protein
LANGKKFEKTRVIVLNTQAANQMNWYLLSSLSDPGNHLEWLESELKELEAIGGNAIVLAHIVPNQFLHAFGLRFRALMDRYQHIVRMTNYGHTHKEYYQITRSLDAEQKPIGFNFVDGSITSFIGKFPGFSLITMDEELMIPLNIETYVFNITEVNLTNEPKWELQHDWIQEYSLQDMRPSNMMSLASTLLNDDAMFYKFMNNVNRRAVEPDVCEGKCRHSNYCQIVATERFQIDECKSEFEGGENKNPKSDMYEILMDPWLKRTDQPWTE